MTLTVRDATVSGATTKGSALTHAEMDANWAHVIQASNSTFTPSGSGATSRAVQAKLQESVSLQDFLPAGYVTDGSVDYSAYLTTALAASNKVVVPGASSVWLIGNVSITGSTSAAPKTLIVEGKVTRTGANPILTLADNKNLTLEIGALDGSDKSQHGILLTGTRQSRIRIGYAANHDSAVHLAPTGSLNCGDNRIELGLAELNNKAVRLIGGSTSSNHCEGVVVAANFIANNDYGIYKDGSGTGSTKFTRVEASFDFQTTNDVYDNETGSASFYVARFTTSAAARVTGNGTATSLFVDIARASVLTGTSIIERGGTRKFRSGTSDTTEVGLVPADGAVELKGTNPYIDFATAVATDFDFRIQQDASGLGLTLSKSNGNAEWKVGSIALVESNTPSNRSGVTEIYAPGTNGNLRAKASDGTIKNLTTVTAAATAIADKTNAINTSEKYAGKLVFDTTNHRVMVAAGSTDVDLWYIADGSGSVTPA